MLSDQSMQWYATQVSHVSGLPRLGSAAFLQIDHDEKVPYDVVSQQRSWESINLNIIENMAIDMQSAFILKALIYDFNI